MHVNKEEFLSVIDVNIFALSFKTIKRLFKKTADGFIDSAAKTDFYPMHLIGLQPTHYIVTINTIFIGSDLFFD